MNLEGTIDTWRAGYERKAVPPDCLPRSRGAGCTRRTAAPTPPPGLSLRARARPGAARPLDSGRCDTDALAPSVSAAETNTLNWSQIDGSEMDLLICDFEGE